MWLKESDLELQTHDKEWLLRYYKIMGYPYKQPEVNYVSGVTIINSDYRFIDRHYTNLDDCICDTFFAKGNDLQILGNKGLSYWREMFHSGYETIVTYGVTDLYEDETVCMTKLFECYPELHVYANSTEGKFALSFSLATSDFRFHKNGGYIGKDDVGEHVYDSPAKEYLTFTVLRIQEDK